MNTVDNSEVNLRLDTAAGVFESTAILRINRLLLDAITRKLADRLSHLVDCNFGIYLLIY